MEAIDHVKLFKLDQENFDFKREEFISELGKEFLEYCQTATIGRDNKSGIIYYYPVSYTHLELSLLPNQRRRKRMTPKKNQKIYN